MSKLKNPSQLIAIVGRPNVGKSTLFNKIVGKRKSLVDDQPGVTRDRITARCKIEDHACVICDTGGFERLGVDELKNQLTKQAIQAVEAAAVVIVVVDVRDGVHPVDSDIIKQIRKTGKPFVIAANKCDTPKWDEMVSVFRQLGSSDLIGVSAEHSRGLDKLKHWVVEHLPAGKGDAYPEDAVKIAFLGRPNVGKSSLLNRMVGEQRSIVYDKPGTTRDVIDVPLRHSGQDFVILDTAGIRNKKGHADKVERLAMMKSEGAIEECDVALLVIDAAEGPTEGDSHVVGRAFELCKPMIIIVNKWDLVADKDTKTTKKYEESLRYKLRYVPFAPILFVSALTNQRVSKILPLAKELHEESSKRVSTAKVNAAIQKAQTQHTAPASKKGGKRIKFYYGTQTGANPPTFQVFCSHVKDIHFSYQRYFENSLRDQLGFPRVPIFVVLRERKRNEKDDHD